MFALKITNIWSKVETLYPKIFDTFEEADKFPIPQRTKNNKVEVLQCTACSGWLLIKGDTNKK